MSKDGEENCGRSGWGGLQRETSDISEDALMALVREEVKRTVGGHLIPAEDVINSVPVSLKQMHPGYDVSQLYVRTVLNMMASSGVIDPDLYSGVGSVFLTKEAYNHLGREESFHTRYSNGTKPREGVIKPQLHPKIDYS